MSENLQEPGMIKSIDLFKGGLTRISELIEFHNDILLCMNNFLAILVRYNDGLRNCIRDDLQSFRHNLVLSEEGYANLSILKVSNNVWSLYRLCTERSSCL